MTAQHDLLRVPQPASLVAGQGDLIPRALHNPCHVNVVPLCGRTPRTPARIVALMVEAQHCAPLPAERNHGVVVQVPPGVGAVLLAFYQPRNGVEHDQRAALPHPWFLSPLRQTVAIIKQAKITKPSTSLASTATMRP